MRRLVANSEVEMCVISTCERPSGVEMPKRKKMQADKAVTRPEKVGIRIAFSDSISLSQTQS